MITSLFKLDTLILFGFIVCSATYTSVIESSFQLFIINYAGTHSMQYNSDKQWYIYDLKNYRFDTPYLLLMVYSVTMLIMHLLPRFPLRFDGNTKSCFWPFFGIFMIAMATACALFGSFFGWNHCWQSYSSNVTDCDT